MSETNTILKQRFMTAITLAYGEKYAQTDPLINVTTNPEFGDYQSNVAMSLARKVGAKPRDIAEALLASLEVDDICEKLEIAGPGFINVFLLNSFIDQQLETIARNPHLGVVQAKEPKNVVVDYSGPNVAKEMHVGHLRSTVIGDAIVRVLMSLGHNVIRQNHMGDWGTQFGMLIEYLKDSGWSAGEQVDSIGDLEKRYQAAKRQFDEDDDFKTRARNRVVALQGGDESTLQMWQYLVDESKTHFSEVYARLGVLLTDEDTCPESFYNSKLADMVGSLETEGVLEDSEGAGVIFVEGFKDRDDKPLPMIVRKSDGGYLYATTDLAALHYRLNLLHAERVIYVTDARQSQHFAMLFAAASKAGWLGEQKLEHVPFGTVLGPNRKPFKTRDGGTVKLVDLMNESETRASQAIAEKNPNIAEEDRGEIAKVIANAALKYADLSSDRIKDYVFDWERMLALEGNTAPYLENAYVRILSIFRKGNIDRNSLDLSDFNVNEKEERALALKLFQFPSVVDSVAERLEPHRLCTYLYELAACFHGFYEACPILKEGVETDKRASRLVLCQLSSQIMHSGMALLGIETVEQM